MLLIPMVLPILGQGGHVGISVPAISSFLVPPYSFVYSSSLCFDSLRYRPLHTILPPPSVALNYEQKVDVHPHDLWYRTDP